MYKILIPLFLLSACSAETTTVEVSNPSDFARKDQSMSFRLDELGGDFSSVTSGGAPVASQVLDTDGDGMPDHLIFIADFKANEVKKFTLGLGAVFDFQKRTHAEVSIKTGGQWNDKHYEGGTFKNVDHVTTPPQYTDHSEYIRYEGPGIESDKVGYRIYLDWRNGFDIFGKVRPGLALHKTGLDGYDSYHHMADWGADILKVGNSLGMGGVGFWNGASVDRVSEVENRSATITHDGAIYSALNIGYQGWSVNGTKVDLSADLSMVAGSSLVHVKLKLGQALPNLVTGLVKHDGTTVILGDLDIPGQAYSYIATFGQQSLFKDNLGMFILFKQSAMSEIVEDEHNQAVVLRLQDNAVDYYFGAVWAGEENPIATREQFETYLKGQAEKLTLTPLTKILK
ncbi:MAG: DUF4861 domain-containing protein [Emcibacter sp.]|nr:DUF4861 domain-containing protein [Emcibacter sp.]